MNKKFKLKNLVTATNIFIVILIIIYLFDCYLPLPDNYTGYTNWDNETPAAVNYILGFCGGLLTNYMGLGTAFVNGNAVYRHFTQIFLHGGLLHLIANAVGLFFIGNYTEKRFGWWLTTILFFVIAFAESYITDPLYMAIVRSSAPSEVSVGASGGIFGLAGASLAAIFFDIKSFEKISKPTIIVSASYGVIATYIVSFGWTTVCHNVAFLLGLALGTAIILPFFLLKKGKFAHTSHSPIQSDVEKNSF